MIKKLFYLILFICCSTALCCEIHLPEHMVILGSNPDVSKLLIQNNCAPENITALNQTLVSVEGKISRFQLSELLAQKSHELQISPHLIHVEHLKNIIREQILTPSGVQLQSSRTMDGNDLVALSEDEHLQLSCENCQFGKQQTLNIHITRQDGQKRSLTVEADFKKLVKAYRLTTFHPAFSEISTSSINEEYVESIPHTELITDIETLKFFKLNKPVRAGELLKQSDLTALSLVKAGVKTEVIIENELIVLKTHGISRNNGSFGQFVEVFHPHKNKKYLGKVIDINKVLVEL
jgi:hypothetical protein